MGLGLGLGLGLVGCGLGLGLGLVGCGLGLGLVGCGLGLGLVGLWPRNIPATSMWWFQCQRSLNKAPPICIARNRLMSCKPTWDQTPN